MTAEAQAALRDGIACIVDGGHPDMRRDLDALRRIASDSVCRLSRAAGITCSARIRPTSPPGRPTRLPTTWRRRPRPGHLGAFGEIGQQGGELTADERKVFEAVGKAQARTGIPIFTHNAYTGRRQVQVPVPKDASRCASSTSRESGRQAGEHRDRPRLLPRRSESRDRDRHREAWASASIASR